MPKQVDLNHIMSSAPGCLATWRRDCEHRWLEIAQAGPPKCGVQVQPLRRAEFLGLGRLRVDASSDIPHGLRQQRSKVSSCICSIALLIGACLEKIRSRSTCAVPIVCRLPLWLQCVVRPRGLLRRQLEVLGLWGAFGEANHSPPWSLSGVEVYFGDPEANERITLEKPWSLA